MIRNLRTQRDDQQCMLDLALNMRGRVQNFEGDATELPPGKRARNYRMIPKIWRQDAERHEALANNGGSTQTFALLTGSPAIDGVTFNVPNFAPSTDQRGIARPQGARYDIGSYELTVGLPWLFLLLGD
jgi:hypothetical protein